MKNKSALYIVATPIGNLSDISQRALDVLQNVALVAAEDTRHSARLLQFHNIKTPMMSYHDHSTVIQTERFLEKLRQGNAVALISDAGTPLISDPGYRLVRGVRDEGFEVVPVPGPCALITALCASGLPSDRFVFEGFPPTKRSGRIPFYQALANELRTLIFYESPHRVLDSLVDMRDAFGGDRRVVFARELTKIYETFLTGTLEELVNILEQDVNQRRGECVVMIAGYKTPVSEDLPTEQSCHVLGILLEDLPLKRAAALTAKITGEKKNKLYRWALSIQHNQ